MKTGRIGGEGEVEGGERTSEFSVIGGGGHERRWS